MKRTKRAVAAKPENSEAAKREKRRVQNHERHMHLLVLKRRAKEKNRRKAARENRN